MARLNVDVDYVDLVGALNFRDPKVLDLVLDKIVNSWDYSQELHSGFADRIASDIRKRVGLERDRIANYGGSIGDNIKFCERELRAGRTIDPSRLRYTSN